MGVLAVFAGAAVAGWPGARAGWRSRWPARRWRPLWRVGPTTWRRCAARHAGPGRGLGARERARGRADRHHAAGAGGRPRPLRGAGARRVRRARARCWRHAVTWYVVGHHAEEVLPGLEAVVPSGRRIPRRPAGRPVAARGAARATRPIDLAPAVVTRLGERRRSVAAHARRGRGHRWSTAGPQGRRLDRGAAPEAGRSAGVELPAGPRPAVRANMHVLRRRRGRRLAARAGRGRTAADRRAGRRRAEPAPACSARARRGASASRRSAAAVPPWAVAELRCIEALTGPRVGPRDRIDRSMSCSRWPSCCSPAPRTRRARRPHEMRGVWVVRTALHSPRGVDRRGRRGAPGRGFNALFVQVRGRGDAFYASWLVRAQRPAGRPAGGIRPAGRVLARAPRARPGGARVVQRPPVGELRPAPAAGACRRTPSRVGDAAAGRRPARVRGPAVGLAWLARQARSTGDVEGLYLSPSRRAWASTSRRRARAACAAIRVDGFHLDFIRYPWPEYDYSRAALAGFRAEQGVKSADAWRLPARHPAAWDEYRRERADRAGRAAGERARASERPGRPGVRGRGARTRRQALHHRFQDWPDWGARSLLDAVCPMAYTADSRSSGSQVAQARARVGDRGRACGRAWARTASPCPASSRRSSSRARRARPASCCSRTSRCAARTSTACARGVPARPRARWPPAAPAEGLPPGDGRRPRRAPAGAGGERLAAGPPAPVAPAAAHADSAALRTPWAPRDAREADARGEGRRRWSACAPRGSTSNPASEDQQQLRREVAKLRRRRAGRVRVRGGDACRAC